MDSALRDQFTRLWETYFPGSELPVTFSISDLPPGVKAAPAAKAWKCLVCDLFRVRKGNTLAIGDDAVSCPGAAYTLGYAGERGPDFRYFLSYGRPGAVEGERYKQRPDLVDQLAQHRVPIPARGKYYLFKRWDTLDLDDTPEVVIFFTRPEVLSGLFTLANFDRPDLDGVICPFGAGCASIIQYPWIEQQKDEPRAVLGMFDPSARPCVTLDQLTMAFPMKKFGKVIGYMEESFLITGTWTKVREKIARSNAIHSQ